jgi:hypothetical protein
MKRTRITLALLMAVVAVVAVDLAAFIIACRNSAGELALGLAPTGLACQIGLLCAVLTGGWSRAFWTGFVVFGCAMMATYAWACGFPESAVNDAWATYAEFAQGVIWTIPLSPWGPYDGGDVFDATIFSLPQLAAACAGGVFASLLTLITRRFFGVRAIKDGAIHPELLIPNVGLEPTSPAGTGS